MEQRLLATRDYRKSIDDELDEREREHQKKVILYKAAEDAAISLKVPLLIRRKFILAIGDSWFDYPIQGNMPLPPASDVLAQLNKICNPSPEILSTAHRGDASTTAVSLPKQRRIISWLRNPANWPNGKPDAILASAGGNDMAGDNFCVFLDFNDGRARGLNQERYAGVLAMVEASYKCLFTLRDRHAPGVPIFANCYDIPTPNGVAAPCGFGPWLQPSLSFNNWSTSEGKRIVRQALQGFRDMLDGLAKDPKHNFHVVQTQGTLTEAQWANELHPDPEGFKLIARKFADRLGISHSIVEAPDASPAAGPGSRRSTRSTSASRASASSSRSKTAKAV